MGACDSLECGVISIFCLPDLVTISALMVLRVCFALGVVRFMLGLCVVKMYVSSL